MVCPRFYVLLAKFKVPREVIVTESIRSGTLGKISKAGLRQRLSG